MRNNNQKAGRAPAVETKVDRPQRGPFKGLRTKPPKAATTNDTDHTTQQQSHLPAHHAVDDLEVTHNTHRRPGNFLPNPKIPSSPSRAPQKKIWEGAYNNFLSLGKQNSPSDGSNLSKSPDMKNPDVKKSSFSILPGTKRLVTQVPSMPTDPYHSLPGGIHSIPAHAKANRAQSLNCSTDQNNSGNSFLRGMFSRSTSDGSVALSRQSRNYSSGSSPDDLDSAMRHGTNKHSPEYNHIPRKQASPPSLPPAFPPTIPSYLPNVKASSQADVPGGLDALLSGAAVSPHITVETAGVPRISSFGMMAMSESVDNISGQYPYYLPKRDSTGSFSYQQTGLDLEDESNGNSSNSSNLFSNRRSESLDISASGAAQGPPQSTGGIGGSLLAQQVAAHAATEMDQQHHHHQQQTYPQHVQYPSMYQQQYHPTISEGQFNGAPASPKMVVGGLDTVLQDPSFASVNSSPSSMMFRQYGRESPPCVDPEKKKVFTAFHNQARFGRDSTSAYLGGESPPAQHPSLQNVTYHMMMGGGGISVPQQGNLNSLCEMESI
jgi:hypothetical protein